MVQETDAETEFYRDTGTQIISQNRHTKQKVVEVGNQIPLEGRNPDIYSNPNQQWVRQFCKEN